MFCVIKIQQFTITEIQVTLLLYISKKLKFPWTPTALVLRPDERHVLMVWYLSVDIEHG